MRFLIDRYSEQRTDSSETRKLWRAILLRYVWRIVLFSVLIIAVIMLSRIYLFPLLESINAEWGHFIATILTLVAMSPFLVMLSFSTTKSSERWCSTCLWRQGSCMHVMPVWSRNSSAT